VLSNILEESNDFNTAKEHLSNSILAHSDWKIEGWDDVMFETAYDIAQKWKSGF